MHMGKGNPVFPYTVIGLGLGILLEG